MSEHHCGPTTEQVRGALMRGEVLGTWERCAECAERERELLERARLILAPESGARDFRPITDA